MLGGPELVPEISMISRLDELLAQYESGRISRRDLLGSLAALAMAAPLQASTLPEVGTVTQLNHVTMFVESVERSVAFYQRLFGMPVLTPQDPGVNLRAGVGFLGLYPAGDGPSGINHACFGVDGFDADAVLQRLKTAGVTGRIRLRGDTKELYFTDPDNIVVQLQDSRYRGGVGPLGDRDPD
jgi:catechol 2,3-dioxygenase-like lactoylglutathione lyase family enzyme